MRQVETGEARPKALRHRAGWQLSGWTDFSLGTEKTHKHKLRFSGNVVRRFTGGFRPQGHLPRLISDGFRPVCSTIRDPRKTPLCAIPLCVFLALLILSSGRAPEWSPTPPRKKIELRPGPGGPGGGPGSPLSPPPDPQRPQKISFKKITC